MFRIGVKIPVNGLNLNRIKKNGCERLYLIARSYETRPNIKSNVREKSSGSAGTLVAFGAVTIGAIGILTYAKNDKEFRATLKGWIPGTDRAIQIIFQEESSYFELIISFFESLKNKISNFIFGEPIPKPGQITRTTDCSSLEDFTPPRPAFIPSALELSPPKPPPIEKPKPEVRISKDEGRKIEVVSEKPVPVSTTTLSEKITADLHELEKYGGELASKAIAAFQQASCAVQDFNQDVMSVVESSDSTVGNQIWDRLKVAQEKRSAAIEEAEKKADEAVATLKQLHSSIDDPKVEATPGQKAIARRNISNILSELDEAKKKFEQEIANANITEKYWKNVKVAREKFQEELQILFPGINTNNKRLNVTDEAFDLFVLHMYHKVAFLQKEFERLQTIADAKVKTALKSRDDQDQINVAVELALAQEKQKLRGDFDKKMLEERKALDEDMRKQLKLQAQIHADHLQEALTAKEREMERKINRVLNEQKEEETIKNKTQLAAVIGRLRGLDEALKKRLDAEKDASEAQLIWGACQALARAVKAAPPGTAPEEALRPLEKEIKAISKAAPKDDVFVTAAIKGIPTEAVKRGVYPEDALRERFLKVEEMASKLALVPAEGAALPIYLLSYLQNLMLKKAAIPIPKHELEDNPIEVESLDTYGVLQRARGWANKMLGAFAKEPHTYIDIPKRPEILTDTFSKDNRLAFHWTISTLMAYWLDRGDFKMTLRYMNLLEGAPRVVARDWMNEARILLETQQAIESLVAYAGANSLVFMGGGVDKKEKSAKK